MKHTKGNWNLKITDGLIKVRTKTRAICGTFKLREKAVTDAFLGELPPHDGAKAYNDESLANAKLIAAAPDLLEALQLMLDVTAVTPIDAERLLEVKEASRTIIKKATL